MTAQEQKAQTVSAEYDVPVENGTIVTVLDPKVKAGLTRRLSEANPTLALSDTAHDIIVENYDEAKIVVKVSATGTPKK